MAYSEDLCQKLISHMSSGMSFSSFGAIANAARPTMYEWVEKYPEFKEAKSKAEAAALRFFEQRAVGLVAGKKIPDFDHKLVNSTMLIFILKTRFHKEYGEKKEEIEAEDELEWV